MQKRTWLVVGMIALVIVVAGAIAFASGGGDDEKAPKPTAHETGPVSVEGTVLRRYTGQGDDPAIGETIPTLEGVSFDGSPITVGPNGKPQAIVFLSHSCPHCQAEVPVIVQLAKEGKLAGVDVTAVATNTNPGYGSYPGPGNYPPSAWLKRAHWPYPVLADSKKLTALVAYGLPAFPYFVFVDADGKVVGRATGEISADTVVEIFKALAAGEPLPLAGGASTTAN